MSKTITLSKVSKEYGDKVLFSDISLKLSERERMCIVGENGAGKSTLMKMIVGGEDVDGGSIIKSPGVRCHYVAQEFNQGDMARTVEQFLETYTEYKNFNKIFEISRALGYDVEKVLSTVCGKLSGGQQKILTLSVGLAVRPDFLLLDEPENHLDIVSRHKLIEMLKAYQGGVVFISHDRSVIDMVADKVAEVAEGTVHVSNGGFQKYLEAKEKRIGGLQRAYDAESARIRQLSKNMRILEKKAVRGGGVSQYRQRKEELSELKEKHVSGRPEGRTTRISVGQKDTGFYDGRLICRVEDAAFSYPDVKTPLFKDVSLELRTGSHVVLLGRNGAGKSTFLKCLMEKHSFTKGSVTWAEGVRTAYFDQHAEFDPEKTPLQIVADELAVDDERAYRALGAMKFSQIRSGTASKNLSGGERMRVRFALVFGAEPNFILLDEPTNHLDEITWEILLDAVNNSPSTILLVTHDYEFIEGVKSKNFWLIHNKTITERHKDLAELVQEMTPNSDK